MNTPTTTHDAAREVDDAEVMKLWRDCGLPEYFLGNGGSNVKLVAFAKACAALSPATPPEERMREVVEKSIRELDDAYTGLDQALRLCQTNAKDLVADLTPEAKAVALAKAEIFAKIEFPKIFVRQNAPKDGRAVDLWGYELGARQTRPASALMRRLTDCRYQRHGPTPGDGRYSWTLPDGQEVEHASHWSLPSPPEGTDR